MKAARKIGTLLMVIFALAGSVFAQEEGGGNLAERQRSPSVLGGTGLFNTFSTRTLCKGEFNFALFWNNFDRDPGDLDINQIPINFTVGLTNRWELWVNWVTWQQTTSRNPFLLSGYSFNTVRLFGDPFTILGPPVGGNDGTAFFPGTEAIFGGILPRLGLFGTPIGFPSSVISPGGPGRAQVIGLGPAFATDRPGFYNELPFFGEIDFVGFDAANRPVFGPRASSNGTGDFTIGTKVNLIDPNRNWFSMALGGYVKIPISTGDDARARGRTSGEWEYGPILMLGQESPGKRFRLYENIGYIHTNDPEENDVKILDLRDKLILNAGLSIGVNRNFEIISEVAGHVYVGGGTPSLNPVNPFDLNVGARFYFMDGAFSFGGAWRYNLTNADTREIPVFRAGLVFVPPFFVLQPLFDTQLQRIEADNAHGFVAYASFGSRRSCPPPPAPTCVLEASSTTVNRGERLTITTRPSTPGWTDDKVTYEYRYEVRDAQGRPVTVSGTGASVDVPTTGLACGTYTVTTTVTATVAPVDCPSECITTGQTTCTTTFEITEPPCPTVTCSISPSSTNVTQGDRVTFRVTGTGGGTLTYTWSTTSGTLSSTTGEEVSLDTTGIEGPVTVTVNVATDRTRCDQPCPGGSCTATITVSAPPPVTPVTPLVPCGPLFFPTNAARIDNEHKACLDEAALRLQQDPRSSLVIDGHRDTSERVGISLTRANNARDYLVNEKGIDAARITVRNFSDTCPHSSGDPNLNRRVELFILPEGATMQSVDAMKQCAAGSSPRVVTDEEPAPERRPRRRAPRRRGRGEPVVLTMQPEPVQTNNQ